MNRGQFERKRASITRARGRSDAWRKRALAHLVDEARAREIVSGKRVLGYDLQDGRVVCVKQRYRDADAANDAMGSIAMLPGKNVRPVRAYRCGHCSGWHLTSQQRA